MTVRAIESRVPAGFDVDDLGEAVVIADGQGDAQYALVSSLTGPLSVGFEVDYAVFVLDGTPVDRYDWTIDVVGQGRIATVVTDAGYTRFTPSAPGTQVVAATLQLASGGTVKMTLVQDVRPAFTGLEFLFEGGGPSAQLDPGNAHVSLAGDPVASAEVFNGLRNYVLSSSAIHGLPPRLLAAVTDAGCATAHKGDRTPWDTWFPGRDQRLEWVAEELEGSTGMITHRDDPVGVCQLRMPSVATIVGGAGLGGAPYVPWREIAADGSDARAVSASTWADYEALPPEARIDLFNLARFPKAQIETCAAFLARLRERPHRYPGSEADDLVGDGFALLTLATELERGATLATSAADGSSPNEIEPTAGSRALVSYVYLPQMIVSFGDSFQDGASDFGGHDLQLDDDDQERRWGGVDPTGPNDPPAGDHVRQLQLDLAELGFTLVGNPTGEFDRFTEWAVREFQVYATMRFLAIEAREDPRWVARLDPALNLYPYAGPISGVANVSTRILIHLWKAKRWRCPVVVEAWETDLANIDSHTVPTRTQPSAAHGNVWRHDETPRPAGESGSDSYLMFVRDFSGAYTFPQNHVQDFDDPDDLVAAGCRFQSGASGGPLTRPGGRYYRQEAYPSVWVEAEILPEPLIGVTQPNLSAAQLATFKVVRAVSEVECLGFFDSVNCWDTAFVSLGPAHWTLGLSNPIREGELCGYLAYLAGHDAIASHEAFERFGVRIDERWVDASGDASGAALFDADQRKYTGRVALQDTDGHYGPSYFDMANANYFRTWHWAYRFMMAGRTVEGFRRGMWDMARIRLRDITTTPFGDDVGIDDVPDGTGGHRPATIGDCFTSEEVTGMLLRWHIYRPFDICADGLAGPRVIAAISAAGLPGTSGDPSQWQQADEDALIERLLAEVANISAKQSVKDDLTRALGWVRSWPTYPGRAGRGYRLAGVAELDPARNSFRDFFDASGLPEAPR